MSVARPRVLATTIVRPMSAMPPGTEGEPRFLEMVKINYDKASKVAKLEKDLSEVIKACNSLLRVNFPLRRDDGSIEVRPRTWFLFSVLLVVPVPVAQPPVPRPLPAATPPLVSPFFFFLRCVATSLAPRAPHSPRMLPLLLLCVSVRADDCRLPCPALPPPPAVQGRHPLRG
jgi:hypothetical protein